MIQMGINDVNNTEISLLLEVLQLSRTAVHQWKAIATQERHTTPEQRLVTLSSPYQRPACAKASNLTSVQLALVPSTRARSEASVSRKRAHSTTPAEGKVTNSTNYAEQDRTRYVRRNDSCKGHEFS